MCKPMLRGPILQLFVLVVCLSTSSARAVYRRRIPADVNEWDYGIPKDIAWKRFWNGSNLGMLRAASANRDTSRLTAVLKKLEAGKPIVVAALGSSVISDNGGCWHRDDEHLKSMVQMPGQAYYYGKCIYNEMKTGFMHNLMHLINTTWPHPDHILVNCAEAANTLNHFVKGTCMEQRLPKTADLLIIEHFEPDVGIVMESLLWRLHEHFGYMPAIIFLNSFKVTEHEASMSCLANRNCTSSCMQSLNGTLEDPVNSRVVLKIEAMFNVLANVYSIPSLSMRYLCYNVIRDEMYKPLGFESLCHFYTAILKDSVHQSVAGNVLLADMLVDLLWQAEEDIVRMERSHQRVLSAGEDVFGTQPRAPMMPLTTVFENTDLVEEHRCYGEVGTPPMKVILADGWTFLQTQTNGMVIKRKPGYVAFKPGSKLHVQLDTWIEGHDQILVGFTYLKSYQHMGMATVQCISGCECNATVLDAHDNTTRTSLMHYYEFLTTPAEKCIIEWKVDTATSSGEHKFKVIQAHVKGLGSSAIEKMKIKMTLNKPGQSRVKQHQENPQLGNVDTHDAIKMTHEPGMQAYTRMVVET